MNPMHYPVTMAKNHGFLSRGVEGKAKKLFWLFLPRLWVKNHVFLPLWLDSSKEEASQDKLVFFRAYLGPSKTQCALYCENGNRWQTPNILEKLEKLTMTLHENNLTRKGPKKVGGQSNLNLYLDWKSKIAASIVFMICEEIAVLALIIKLEPCWVSAGWGRRGCGHQEGGGHNQFNMYNNKLWFLPLEV